MNPPLDPSRCPLCGEPNGCGMAAGTSSCWCMTATIAPAALERLPEAARGELCVCAKCAALGRASVEQPPEPSD
ncbi:MAG TPA: cysteine-rich CWC family protein [Polyangiaceae bacterium]|nr:cysteine-rich CWC family protein [Polyangiaceae bacterium]